MSSLSLGDCTSFSYDPLGRQPISVAQRQTGLNYPFVAPSPDIQYLVADLQLSLDDRSFFTYQGQTFRFRSPFRLLWLYGAGCTGEGVPASGGPTAWFDIGYIPTYSGWQPTTQTGAEQFSAGVQHNNPADLVIVDADDRIVFASSDVPTGGFFQRPWGNNHWVYSWAYPGFAGCTLVINTTWPEDQSDLVPTHYPKSLFPTNAVLDARCVTIVPRDVFTVRSGLTTIDLGSTTTAPRQLNIVGGYNISIDTTQVVRGLQTITQLTINAAPGSGAGVYTDCVPEPLTINTVNGVAPDANGQFYLSAADCYYFRQPTSVSAGVTTPLISVAPGNVTNTNLPDVNAGKTKLAAGWPTGDSPTYAHLQVGNNCSACADCDDFVATANYMNTTAQQYIALGQQYSFVRQQHNQNVERWKTAAKCIFSRPIRVSMQPQVCPHVDVLAQYCNQGTTCQTQIKLTVTLSDDIGTATGTEVPGYTYLYGGQVAPGTTGNQLARGNIGGTWPTFTAHFDTVYPGQSVYVQFRLKIGNCGMAQPDLPYTLTATATGETAGGFISATNSLGKTIKASAQASAILPCPPSQYAPVATISKCGVCN